MVSGTYDPTEFDVIRYFDDQGGLSCPESMARIAYYGVGVFPTLIWNGTEALVGGGQDAIDGSRYDAMIQAHLADATPWALQVTDHHFGGGAFATVRVSLEADVPDISGHFLRIAVVENGLTYAGLPEEDVLRRLIAEEPIGISAAGQVETHTALFEMDADWDPAHLRVVAFVQRDSDKAVLQSCNSLPASNFAFRYCALGERMAVTAGRHEFDDFALFNVGELADTYDLALDTADLPGDWQAYLTDGASDYGALQVTLAPGERAGCRVVLAVNSAGGGSVELVLHGEGARTGDRRLRYSAISSATQVLLVADDGTDAFETRYYAPAIAAAGRTYAIWDRGAAPLTGELLANFGVVVWDAGAALPTLDAADRAALGAYLDGGGRLFVSGQDIAWELATQQGGVGLPWLRAYLHADYVADDVNNYLLTGVAGDPISDGLHLTITGGDGANNQQYPDGINANDAAAHAILTYGNAFKGALAADTGADRVVYLSFGFEAIDNAADRALLMQRALDWLRPDLTGAPAVPAPLALRLEQNRPNPFNPSTAIRYTLPSAGEASLLIFDAGGRRVATLLDGPQPAGAQEVLWNGRDDAGNALATGMYFCRLQSAAGEETRKMLLLK